MISLFSCDKKFELQVTMLSNISIMKVSRFHVLSFDPIKTHYSTESLGPKLIVAL